MNTGRRRFLVTTAALGIGSIAATSSATFAEGTLMDSVNKEAEEEISATEDLMREHGVLNRILLIYDEGIRRLHAKEEVPPEVFHRPATLVRKFVEDYHEKLEENFIFPEFEKQQKQLDLVKVLREQHQAGRKMTDVILRLATADQFTKPDARAEIARSCAAFTRMYRPHEAREDTVLFPALRKIVPAHRVAELGEQFEDQEHKLFGDDGFAKAVDEVAAVEKQLGIYDLAQFTAK